MFKLPNHTKSETTKKPSELISDYVNPWEQQKEILTKYETIENKENIAIEMPTGTGKTLVALTIASYKQQSQKLKVVYLVPNNQLAKQVHDEANRCNIKTSLFTKNNNDSPNYTQEDIDKYHQAKTIAITSYSGLFNSNPKTKEPDLVICDDIMAAEDAIGSLWTLEIIKAEDEDIYNNIKKIIDYRNEPSSIQDNVDLVELSVWADKRNEIIKELRKSQKNNIKYTIESLGNNILTCNMFISEKSILIRPFLIPIFSFNHYANAKQRIFLSATFGTSGDFERIAGTSNISFLKCSSDIINGLRYIIYPHLITEKEQEKFIIDYIKMDKSLIIVNSDNRKNDIKEYLKTKIPNQIIYDGETIKANNNDLTIFLNSGQNTTLILSNRFYGIDLPDDTCRQLVLLNTPLYSNLQEKFFWNALGTYTRFKEKISIRIIQALGRCTRKKNDFASILIVNNDLINWLQDIRNRELLPPQLQAELRLAAENVERDANEILKQIEDFRKNPETRKLLNEWVIDEANSIKQEEESLNKILRQCVESELQYVKRLYGKDYENAYASACSVIKQLSNSKEGAPYKAFWNYLASCAAYLGFLNTKKDDLKFKYNEHVEKAIIMTPTLNWLGKAKEALNIDNNKKLLNTNIIINKLNCLKFKTDAFPNKIKDIRNKLENTENHKIFSSGLCDFGQLLGYNSATWEQDKKVEGAPDCYWEFPSREDFLCFEAKSETESKEKAICCDYVGQISRQSQWLRSTLNLNNNIKVYSVMVTPQILIKIDAHKSAREDDLYLSTDKLLELFGKLEEILIDLSVRSRGKKQEEVINDIYEVYKNNHLFSHDIFNSLEYLKSIDIEKK